MRVVASDGAALYEARAYGAGYANHARERYVVIAIRLWQVAARYGARRARVVRQRERSC